MAHCTGIRGNLGIENTRAILPRSGHFLSNKRDVLPEIAMTWRWEKSAFCSRKSHDVAIWHQGRPDI